MPDGYGSHADYMSWVADDAKARQKAIEKALREARRDIHKRCDEIVNKSAKLKSVFPKAKFAAVIYYPFVDEHINIQNRLSSDNIDAISFAAESEDSIENAVRMLLARLGVAR